MAKVKKRLLKKHLNLIYKGLYQDYKKAMFADSISDIKGFKRFQKRKNDIKKLNKPEEIYHILYNSTIEDFQWNTVSKITNADWNKLNYRLYILYNVNHNNEFIKYNKSLNNQYLRANSKKYFSR